MRKAQPRIRYRHFAEDRKETLISKTVVLYKMQKITVNKAEDYNFLKL